MKKTSILIIGITVALSACRQEVKDEWTSGYDDPKTRDTVINNRPYRSHYGMYYPIIRGMISPSSYRGASMNEISSPHYSPSRVSRGGFGGRFRSGG